MNQVTRIEQPVNVPATTDSQPMRLVELAIQQGADVDKLERLMDMQERWENREAQKAFNRAVSNFQAICPRIKKTKQGHGYKYATLADIQAQIKDAARDCGLSWRWEHKATGTDTMTVTCIVTHIDGHSERTESSIIIDEPNKAQSKAQMIGVATTYGQRYSLIGALGISTADEDMDARLPQEFREKEKYNKFKEQRESIKNAIAQGQTAENIIEQLEQTYILTGAVKQAIFNMENNK